MSDDKKKSEEKGYFSKLINGISNSAGYIGGGVYNIGKGIVHTVGGAVGVGPGMESGINKLANGTGSIIDGVVQGSVESIAGASPDRAFRLDADELLRRYSVSELRQLAKENPRECLDIIDSAFHVDNNYEDGLRFLKVIAPVVSEWPEEEQAHLLNRITSKSGTAQYAQISAVETLFEAGVSPNVGKKTNVNEKMFHLDPVSPFYRVVTGPFYNPELLQVFLEHGADPLTVVSTQERGSISIYESAFDSRRKDLMSDYIPLDRRTTLDRLNQENITREQPETNIHPSLNAKER